MFTKLKSPAPTIEIVEKLLSEISSYKYSKDLNPQTLVEMLGFAFALLEKCEDSYQKRRVKNRLIEEMSEFTSALYPLKYRRSVAWSNLFENLNGYKARYLSIWLRHKLKKLPNVQPELTTLNNDILRYIENLLEGSRKDCKYLLVGQHKESQSTTSIYDAEYLLVSDSENEQDKNYFTAFYYLFNFMMISSGLLAINTDNPLLEEYRDYFYCLEGRYNKIWNIKNIKLLNIKINLDQLGYDFDKIRAHFSLKDYEENPRNKYSFRIYNCGESNDEEQVKIVSLLPGVATDIYIDDVNQQKTLQSLQAVRKKAFASICEVTNLNLDLSSIVMNYATHFSHFELKEENVEVNDDQNKLILR